MADDPKFTQADIDKAVKDAIDEATKGLKENLTAALDEAKDAKRKLRAASEIKPEDVAALEADLDKARADLAEANKSVKTLTVERDKAVKSLETEQGAARNYALDAEINAAIAEGNVVPALVPAFSALLRKDAKVDLVDGKYAALIGDKSAKEYVSTFLASEDGKSFKAAAANNGGGAPGGKTGEPAKTMTRAEFDAKDGAAKVAFAKEGGEVVDATA